MNDTAPEGPSGPLACGWLFGSGGPLCCLLTVASGCTATVVITFGVVAAIDGFCITAAAGVRLSTVS